MTDHNDDAPPEEDETASFVVALLSAVIGILSLIAFAVLKGLAAYSSGAAGEVVPLQDKRWWFLVAGVGLTVLGVGLQAHRFSEFVSQRRSLVALNVAAMIVLAFVLTGLANYLGARHFHEFDWTRTGVFSIDEGSIEVVSHLEKPIRCWLIWPSSDENAETVRRLLDHYKAKSDKFTIETADPGADLANYEMIVKKLGIDDRNFEDQAGVVVQSGYYDEKGDWKAEKSKHVSHRELFEQSMEGPHGGGQKKFKGEQVITNAIIEVTDAKKEKLYFLTGHRELDLEGQGDSAGEMGFVSKLLRQKNYEVAVLNILSQKNKDVPEDASAVIVAAPKSKLDDGEIAALEEYLKKDGKLFVLLGATDTVNAQTGQTQWVPTGLEPLLKRYNVEVEEKVLVSFERRGPYIAPTASTYLTWFDPENKITQPLASTQARGKFLAARPLKVLTENPHARVTELARTPEAYYAVSDPSAFMQDPSAEAEQKPQAFPVMVAVEQTQDTPPAPPSDKDKDKKPKEKVTRIVVAGDGHWVSNRLVDESGYRNEPLFFNCISYLVGQERFRKDPVKESGYKLDLNEAQIMLYSAFSLLGLPLFAIMLGLSVWLIRRR